MEWGGPKALFIIKKNLHINTKLNQNNYSVCFGFPSFFPQFVSRNAGIFPCFPNK